MVHFGTAADMTARSHATRHTTAEEIAGEGEGSTSGESSERREREAESAQAASAVQDQDSFVQAARMRAQVGQERAAVAC